MCTITDPATRARDAKNARRRAAYKKKKEDEGYQEQIDKLNTRRPESYQKNKQHDTREQRENINARRRAAYQKKTQDDTNTGHVLSQQQRDIINAKRRATYKEKKEQINTQRRETDQKHRDSLTPVQKGEMSAQHRQREKAMRNTPCAESIAMPRPDLATSAAASTCGHTFKTYGISRMCTPHLLFVCIKQIFTCSVSVQPPTVPVRWTIISSCWILGNNPMVNKLIVLLLSPRAPHTFETPKPMVLIPS